MPIAAYKWVMADAAERQIDFSTFYDMVQRRAGIEQPKPAVAAWALDVQEAIAHAFETAVIEAQLIGRAIDTLHSKEDGTVRSNQSKGNVLANVLADAFAAEGAALGLRPIAGAGYPDRILVYGPLDFKCAFEIKATGDWDDRDSNRRVLTSSPEKLLRAIVNGDLPDPPCHLLGTVIYNDDTAEVESVRLDFLEPNTLVGVRLEASTSHKLLATGGHLHLVIG